MRRKSKNICFKGEVDWTESGFVYLCVCGFGFFGCLVVLDRRNLGMIIVGVRFRGEVKARE